MSPVKSTDGHQDFFDSIDLHGKPVTAIVSYEDLAKIEAVEDAVATAQLKQAMAESTGFVTAVELFANADNRAELKQEVKNAISKSVPLQKAPEISNPSPSPTLSPSPPPPPPGEQNPPWLQIVLGIIGAIGLIGAAFVGRKK
jgi:hypothetical protein